MEKQNFEFGRIRSKYGIVNTFPYFGVIVIGHCLGITGIDLERDIGIEFT
jgi:hypothetical protein